MSTVPLEPAGQVAVRPARKSLRRILLFVLLAPLIAVVALGASTLRSEQRTEQKRLVIGAAGGRSEIERRVPAWLAPIVGDNFHTFLGHPTIVGVTMTGNDIGDRQVAAVTDVPDLVRLNLDQSRVTSAALTTVARLQSLRQLSLINTQITELTELTKLPALEDLRIDYNRGIQREHLSALAEFPGLRVLGAGGLRLTDEGVAAIGNCARLEELSITGSTLGENGLQPLQNLKQLKLLTLTYSTYNPGDLAAFRQAVPDCTVVQ